MDELGVNYFVHNFVVGSQHSPRGFFNYVPPVYLTDGEHRTLEASMTAVGLMALANSSRQPELIGHARSKYSQAINNVNCALASPTESLKDSTLMSVISLGVFEHYSEHKSWVRHVEGAAALVIARGKDQFASRNSMRMFNQVRADLVVSCLHGTKAIPKEMLELQIEASKYMDTSGAFWQLGIVSTELTNYLYTIRTNKGNISWTELLDKADELELQFKQVVESLTVEEPYTTTRLSDWDPDVIYNGRLDLYQDFWAIRVWNNARCLQMILYEIRCFLLNSVLARDIPPSLQDILKPKLHGTVQQLAALGEDMLASVPQALKCVSTTSGPRSRAALSFHGNVSGGYMLSWSLYMVGKCVVTKKEARKWTIRALQDLGWNIGIPVALELLEDILKIDQWAS